MTLDQIRAFLENTRDCHQLCTILHQYRPNFNNIVAFEKEYYPELHKIIHDKVYRRDKIIKDDNNNITGTVPVARLSLGLQKKIVLFAAAFLGVPRIDATPDGDLEDNFLEVLNEIQESNKMEYRFPEICRIVMKETQAAELWYLDDDDASDGQPIYPGIDFKASQKIKMKILANSFGDKLHPVFNAYDRLIAFGREYSTREYSETKKSVIDVRHFDLYSDDEIYYSKNDDPNASGWLFYNGSEYTADFTSVVNSFGKIPVIYYEQQQVEWKDVQPLIDRLEVKISNHADTNDYFDSPVAVVNGKILSFTEKGDAGKLIEILNGGDLKYVTWDNAPASMELEMKNLNYWIHSLSHTPDISFESIKGLGKLSGIALRFLFMDAHLKATQKEAIFGIGVQRRINLLKHAVSTMDTRYQKALTMKMKPKFTYFAPEDVNALITTLGEAMGAGILSQETAVGINPLVTDPETELENIRAEAATDQANQVELAAAGAQAQAKKGLPIPSPTTEEAAVNGE